MLAMEDEAARLRKTVTSLRRSLDEASDHKMYLETQLQTLQARSAEALCPRAGLPAERPP